MLNLLIIYLLIHGCKVVQIYNVDNSFLLWEMKRCIESKIKTNGR